MDNERFLTAARSMTLRQYFEIHGNSYPSFIEVTQGYLGDNELETLARGQIIRINSCVQHRRILGVDSYKRTLSIPADYQILFNVITSHGKCQKGAYKLGEIVSMKGLPVVVQIADSRRDSFLNNQLENKLHTLGTIRLTESYDERYFLSNTVVQGGLAEPHLIPLYLKDIMVAKITGIKGETVGEWIAFQERVSAQHKKVTVPPTCGLTEIAIYTTLELKGGSDNIYDFIEPSSYIYADYKGMAKVPVLPPKPLPVQPLSTGSDPPSLPKRKTVKEPDINVISVRPENKYVNDIARAAVKPFSYIAHAAADKAKSKTENSQGQADEQSQNIEYISTWNRRQRYDCQTDEGSNGNQGRTDLIGQRDGNNPESRRDSDSSESRRVLYQCNAVYRRDSVQRDDGISVTQRVSDESSYGSLRSLDVAQTADVEAFRRCSIDDMEAMLQDLRLSKYVSKFREHGVDGELAMEFDESILREDFKFSKFESMKFLKFLKTGHIPR